MYDTPAIICTTCAVWHANGDATALDTDSSEYVAVTTAPGVPIGHRVVVDGMPWEFMNDGEPTTCDTCERDGYDVVTARFVLLP